MSDIFNFFPLTIYKSKIGLGHDERSLLIDEVYNLEKDSEETTNLIEMDKDRLKDMQIKWNEWSADLIDCIFPSLSKDEWW